MDESFGQALRRLRGTRSLRDVALLANCGKSYVADLEQDKKTPSPAMAAALDDAVGAGGELRRLAATPPGASLSAQAAALQAGLLDALSAGPMTAMSVEEVEYAVARHGRATRYRAESDQLPDLIADFTDLNRLLAHRHPAPARRRLTVAAAQMSGLMALTLLKLGDPAARNWWRTGRAAAAAAEDRATLSWMYAQEAYQLYYEGDVHGAVELAIHARDLAGGLPCVGPALAAPLEARAYARLGRAEQTASALRAGEAALERLDGELRTGSAFGYSESQLRFHAGNAWTHLRQTGRARAEQERALELYPMDDHTDRAFIGLDQAMCYVIEGEPVMAAAHATATLMALPEEHRSPLIIYRARELADRVPDARSLPEGEVLREVLALPAGEG
ncbi:helix-turn-helix domain-containing protein [Streptomyces violascens]|uniref:helix-turn-helix domain-containing protein n=1 Tax=Streptomyces violascens TaxID=67381 RepID=UPI0016747C80|nr:helix-turn-helix transcriptional regulator [Streptomyces violascens]GGU42960.1 hypothetical protein GCM10010289_74690 [Streptomyces violascens]